MSQNKPQTSKEIKSLLDDQQKELQALTEQYQSFQGDLQEIIQARQKLESQLQENRGVQKEFKNLKKDGKVYKLVGPVLLSQDLSEAIAAVNGRLEFIDNEVKRAEKQLTDIQVDSEKVKMRIIQAQTAMQQQQTQTQNAQVKT